MARMARILDLEGATTAPDGANLTRSEDRQSDLRHVAKKSIPQNPALWAKPA